MAWDLLGRQMIVNHNFEALLAAHDTVNTILEAPPAYAGQFLPGYLVRAYNGLLDAFRQPNPISHVSRFAADFAKF
jgi:hypothetical protein